MANFSYVVDSSFQPFSMQEMLVPFSAYKDAFEKGEEAYNDLTDKSDKFKYLSDTLPEGSRARQLYEGYANDLKTQAEDLAHNGLTMTNRRALTSLKRRYQGEIGRLIKADEAMDVEKKLRQSLNAQDSSRLYATDNLNIDDFLDGRNPNLYSISGNELYTRGAAAGKAASSRVFSAGDEGSTLGGYYRDYVQRMGYGADTMQKFREDMSAIPELQMAADAILEERGVPQNLTGVNLQRARQSVINGMIDGAVYQEQHNPQRDLGVMTAGENAQIAMQKRSQNISLGSQGLTYDEKTGKVTYDPNNDPSLKRAATVAQIKSAGKSANSGSSGNSRTAAYDTRNKKMVIVGAESGTIYRSKDDDNSVVGKKFGDLDSARELNQRELTELVDANGNITNEYIRNAIGNGNISDYEIYKVPKGSGSGWFSSGTDEDIYVAVPRETKRSATGRNTDNSVESTEEDTNDIPS